MKPRFRFFMKPEVVMQRRRLREFKWRSSWEGREGYLWRRPPGSWTFMNVLRQAFPGHGHIKPEQLEIDQLKREVATPKASLNNFPAPIALMRDKKITYPASRHWLAKVHPRR